MIVGTLENDLGVLYCVNFSYLGYVFSMEIVKLSELIKKLEVARYDMFQIEKLHTPMGQVPEDPDVYILGNLVEHGVKIALEPAFNRIRLE